MYQTSLLAPPLNGGANKAIFLVWGYEYLVFLVVVMSVYIPMYNVGTRSIDIGVAISASVILGIAVDDTIHFFSKYFDAIKTMIFEESIDHVISHTGNAMILTTFILSFTFAIFGVSSFVPNVNFSIVTVVALNLALLLDLVLLPAVLSLGVKK